MDLTTIEKPFGLLDEETKEALRRANVAGQPFEWLDPHGEWVRQAFPIFVKNMTYRVCPTPKPPAIELPWDVIDPRWKWAALNENSGVYLHQTTPFVQAYCWISDSRARWITHVFDGIRINVTDWKQSLTKRPE